MKNHYLLTQIADILMRLYENGSSVIKKVKKTIKEKSLDLFEAIRGRIVTDKDLAELDTPIQVRFT
ncbi:transposase [Bacillus fonticola]|uniref:transposase n=1 Tax=Bacillus fonticola TaxID=2728853 RepID=UPI001D14BAAA|nr:transposase [Bacillus fonticola]